MVLMVLFWALMEHQAVQGPPEVQDLLVLQAHQVVQEHLEQMAILAVLLLDINSRQILLNLIQVLVFLN
jgi:hypothetical protein